MRMGIRVVSVPNMHVPAGRTRFETHVETAQKERRNKVCTLTKMESQHSSVPNMLNKPELTKNCTHAETARPRKNFMPTSLMKMVCLVAYARSIL